MPKLRVPQIPDDAIVTLDISGHFYKKLQTIFLARAAERSKEEFTALLEKLKTDEPIADLYEAEIQVLASLVISIEKAAQKQNKLEFKEIEEDPKA